MTPCGPRGEPITLRVREDDGQPAEFAWIDGQVHRVTAICRQWRIHTAWWRESEIRRQYWELTTDTGFACVIFHDLDRQAWFMERIWK